MSEERKRGKRDKGMRGGVGGEGEESEWMDGRRWGGGGSVGC